MLTDALGRPLRFLLSPGQMHDSKAALELLQGVDGGGVIADKAYDSNEIRGAIAKARMQAVIPSNRNRKVIIPHDVEVYKIRNRIERCFNKLKHFRHFATRYDRREIHFLAFIHLASAMLWLR
jgi:transposase